MTYKLLANILEDKIEKCVSNPDFSQGGIERGRCMCYNK